MHPDLLPALGRLIAAASQRSQVLVVTHREPCETRPAGLGRFDQPAGAWGSR